MIPLSTNKMSTIRFDVRPTGDTEAPDQNRDRSGAPTFQFEASKSAEDAGLARPIHSKARSGWTAFRPDADRGSVLFCAFHGIVHLGAAKLAATFGLSRASLYRLFAPVGGVASASRESLDSDQFANAPPRHGSAAGG